LYKNRKELKITGYMAQNYNDKWKELSKDNFFFEGKLQAEALNKYITINNSVMEFGCGNGRILMFINAAKKYGVDVWQSFLDMIIDKEIIEIKSDGYNFDTTKIDSIDFIYSLMVFQHTKKADHVDMIRMLYNLLSKSGKLLIQFPKKSSSYYKQTEFVNTYTKDEIKNYCIICKIENYTISEDNLIGYKDGLTSLKTKTREYFLIINK
jgi:SAM-dependent methyltransferase